MSVLAIVLMALPQRPYGPEDQVEFKDANGAPRVLRGRIVRETDLTITMDRMDGQFEISRASITKVVRRTPQARDGGVMHTIRQKMEESRQRQFVQMVEAIKAGTLTDRQIADRADCDLATVERVRALIRGEEVGGP